jgi:hypothetical protein
LIVAVLLDTDPSVALLKRSCFDPSLALQFIERGVVPLPFALQEQIGSVS